MELPEENVLSAIVPKGCKDEFCKKFIFKDEDHTLGNALRFVISNYPEVKFCAYTIPHPAEKKLVLQIQTIDVPAVDILRRGLQDLGEVCDHTIDTFETAMSQYTASVDKSKS